MVDVVRHPVGDNDCQNDTKQEVNAAGAFNHQDDLQEGGKRGQTAQPHSARGWRTPSGTAYMTIKGEPCRTLRHMNAKQEVNAAGALHHQHDLQAEVCTGDKTDLPETWHAGWQRLYGTANM